MNTWNAWHDPILINTVGHWAGVLLFSATILLMFRNWRLHGIKTVKLPLIAAGLALGWNLGSLMLLARPNASAVWTAAVVTASFSMLTVLPAVLLQVAWQGRKRLITAIGYCIGAMAAILHVSELWWTSSSLHQAALVCVVGGFGAICLACLGLELRNQKPDSSRLVSLVCLLLFTSSFYTSDITTPAHPGPPRSRGITSECPWS